MSWIHTNNASGFYRFPRMRVFIFRPHKLKCACEKVKCACDKAIKKRLRSSMNSALYTGNAWVSNGLGYMLKNLHFPCGRLIGTLLHKGCDFQMKMFKWKSYQNEKCISYIWNFPLCATLWLKVPQRQWYAFIHWQPWCAFWQKNGTVFQLILLTYS